MRERLLEAQKRIEDILKLSDSNLIKISTTSHKLQNACRDIRKVTLSIPYVGKLAKVKSDTKWTYKGCTFEILEVYMVEDGVGGVYKKGSLQLRLNLVGTEFEYRKTGGEIYHNTTTVINTEDLLILT